MTKLFNIGQSGHDGAEGLIGPPGAPGRNGQDGDRGPQGSQGPPGARGQTGERGIPGSSGGWGVRGDTGLRGSPGSPGSRGGYGATGAKGFKGQRGSSGRGQKGQRGDPGFCRRGPCPRGLQKRSIHTSEVNSDIEINTPGVVYTRWGERTCPGNETKTVFSGTVASTTAANYLCLPSHNDHQRDEGEPASQKTNTEANTTTLYTSGIPCSVCLALKHSTVLTVPAEVICPLGWTREYHGLIMNGSSEDGQYHCMDWSRSKHSKSWLDHIKVSSKVNVGCIGSDCRDDVIECAVCTL